MVAPIESFRSTSSKSRRFLSLERARPSSFGAVGLSGRAAGRAAGLCDGGAVRELPVDISGAELLRYSIGRALAAAF
eukprot:scaffold193_cov255-Pinguiococcus_pyrenoidosus.AAC.16